MLQRHYGSAEALYNMKNRAYKYTFNDIIGNEPIRRAPTAILTARGITVLITGESGTGRRCLRRLFTMPARL